MKASVRDLGWFQGSWQCEIWGGIFEEHWTSPDGGTILQMGRHLVEGQTRFVEYGSLEPTEEGGITLYLHLGALSKGPAEPKAFPLTKITGQEAVFENPQNPFPSVITYHRRGDALQCVITGEQNGIERSDRFDFKRIR